MMRVWRAALRIGLVASVFFGRSHVALAATTNVNLTTTTTFSPATVSIKTGDTVHWVWVGSAHSTTSNGGLWDSGQHNPPFTFDFTFNSAGNFPYHCSNPFHTSMTGTVIVSAQNQAPSVTVTNPANNSVFSPPANFSLGASASDSDGTVSQVEFLRNSTSIGVDTTSPYSVSVTNLGSGTYTFSAVATDNSSNKATNSISVVVNALPTVSVTNPANATVFAAPATFAVGASASDSDGTVSQVEFFRNGTSIGIDTTSPYSTNVTSLGAGTYTFMAVATDNNNGKATNSISVVVNALPSVTVTNPANNTVFAPPASFSIGASASDSDGTVSQVEFFRNGTSIGIDTTSPYSSSVTNLGAGTYTLMAVATDNNNGKTTNSIGVVVNALPSVTVTNPANNTVFAEPASFSVGASASDSDGTVSQVEFLRNGTSIGVDTTSPYSSSVTNLAAGTYTFSSVATDNNNGKTTNSINVVVNALPTVAITNPPSGSTFATPWSGPIQATASDRDGSVVRVQFFSDGVSLGIVSNAPYSLSSSVSAGAHILTAVSMDDRGATNGSTPVSVTVVNPGPIVLSGAGRLSASQFRFTHTADPGLKYAVERGSSLAGFAPLETNVAGSTNVVVVDGNATNSLNYYRVRRVP